MSLPARFSSYLLSYFQTDQSETTTTSATMMKRPNLNRRNSKRFVIGDEEDMSPPDIEITIAEAVDVDVTEQTRSNEWLEQSSRLKPGTTLT